MNKHKQIIMFQTNTKEVLNRKCCGCVPIKIGVAIVIFFELLQALNVFIPCFNQWDFGKIIGFLVDIIPSIIFNTGIIGEKNYQIVSYVYGGICLFLFILGCIAYFMNKASIYKAFKISYSVKAIFMIICGVFGIIFSVIFTVLMIIEGDTSKLLGVGIFAIGFVILLTLQIPFYKAVKNYSIPNIGY